MFRFSTNRARNQPEMNRKYFRLNQELLVIVSLVKIRGPQGEDFQDQEQDGDEDVRGRQIFDLHKRPEDEDFQDGDEDGGDEDGEDVDVLRRPG